MPGAEALGGKAANRQLTGMHARCSSVFGGGGSSVSSSTVNRTSQKLPLLADMLQTAVNTSEARELAPAVKKERLGAKAQLPVVLPSRGFRVHIHRDQGRASRQSYGKGEGLLTLSYWCFDPAAAMEQLARLQVWPSLTGTGHMPAV